MTNDERALTLFFALSTEVFSFELLLIIWRARPPKKKKIYVQKHWPGKQNERNARLRFG